MIYIPYINMTFLFVDLPPEAFVKSNRISLNLQAMIGEAPPRKRVSSANYEWLTLLAPRAILMPEICLVTHPF
jgi:hypothetical protein